MTPTDFVEQLRLLTGRPVHPFPLPFSDMEALGAALADDSQLIDYSQFNELLLLANKDRVESPFFQRFFCSSNDGLCRVGDLSQGVRKFQKMAMLRFGNFIYAYRTLSRLRTVADLKNTLGELESTNDIEARLATRRGQIIDIEHIERENTFFIGYLSAGAVREDYALAKGLLRFLNSERYTSFDELTNDLESMREQLSKRGESTTVVHQSVRLVNRFKKRQGATLGDLHQTITDDEKQLAGLHTTLEATLKTGTDNSDIYLTWDHMDVYFATSMRKRWEFEDLYDFVNELMLDQKIDSKGATLADLNVRYFDPTQSFDQNRVNKGLIEALMLKRAACTVYSVQDTDTLGKDSELAATLAQGKPVIAYAPAIVVNEQVERLKHRRPSDLKQRLQWVIYERGFIEDPSFVNTFAAKLEEFEETMLWQSIVDLDSLKRFQTDNDANLERFCTILASSEKEIYDRRYRTLQKSHPLGLQVNLDTGVANGVLVVRNTNTCAELLWRVLTNALEFDVSYDDEAKCWYLTETLTGSIYRVVTSNEKLTNCFWNFYSQNA